MRPRITADWLSLGTSASLLAGSAVLLAWGSETAIERGGDLGQLLNPTAAVAIPIAKRDWRGLLQYGLVFGTTMGLTFGMKALVEKRRPDSKDAGSYPSGHTAAAFSGAAFLYTRYGARYGIPAYVLAMYTGLSRVSTRRHYLDDVIAGAGVAMITNWMWALPFGLETDPRLGRTVRPTWRLEFGFGTIRQYENDISSPVDVGTEVDLARLEGADDQLATARFSAHWYASDRHEVMVRVDPIELRGVTTPEEPVHFGDAVFAAGSELFVRWVGAEYKLRWRYELAPWSRRFSFRPGVSAIVADYLVEFSTDTARKRIGNVRVIPAPHLHAAYEVLPRLVAQIETDGIPGIEFMGFDAEATLRWRVSSAWDIGVMYRISRRQVGGDIDNDPSTHGLYLLIGRLF